jgi:hypothetical protein
MIEKLKAQISTDKNQDYQLESVEKNRQTLRVKFSGDVPEDDVDTKIRETPGMSVFGLSSQKESQQETDEMLTVFECKYRTQ